MYDALAQTPFLSLYATASRQEDLAELVVWHEIYTQDGGDLIIGLKDAVLGEDRRRMASFEFS